MSAADRELKRLAKELAAIKREVVSRRGPQLDYTSVEDGGNITLKGSDGSVKAVVGGQDDGSTTVRHVDGPIPPVPTAPAVYADGPVVTVEWDSGFVAGAVAPHDLDHIKAVAKHPLGYEFNGMIVPGSGFPSWTFVAPASGTWTVTLEAVSKAAKVSAPSASATITVELVDLNSAIESVQQSANGKNTVTTSSRPPTSADPGILDDTWWVGVMGRPNDVVEGRNLCTNPSFETTLGDWFNNTNISTMTRVAGEGVTGGFALRHEAVAGATARTYVRAPRVDVSPGQWLGVSAAFKGASGNPYLRIRYLFYTSANVLVSDSWATPFTATGAVYARVSGAAVVPATAAYALPYAYIFDAAVDTAPTPGRAWFTDRWMFATGATEAEALSKVATYFDGDTPSGATVNESHYRWTGTPHASASEKYLPALPGTDSDVWNITEQYRHLGTFGWQKVALSHEVIATLDVAKVKYGQMSGQHIEAKSIVSGSFAGGAFDGEIFTGSTFQTGQTGSRIVINPGGFTSYRSDEKLRVYLPTDSDQAFVDADLTARSLTAIGDVSLRSATTVESGGGSLTIGSGVTDPSSPASVSPWYQQVRPPALGQDETPYGLAWADGRFWRFAGVDGSIADNRIESINPDTGAITATVPITGGFWAAYGMTAIGTRLYLLGRKANVNYRAFVRIYETTGAYVGEWEYPNIGWSPTNPLVFRPGIGTDGTNVVIAQCDDGGVLIWRKFSRDTGAPISTHTDPGDATRSDVAGIYIGNADWGAQYAVVGKKKSNELVAFLPSGTYAGPDMKAPVPGTVNGVCWDGTRFWTIDDAGVITRYESAQHGNKAAPWWVGYTYTDGSGHETRVGPVAAFQWPRRSGLMVSIPDAPQGATGARIYWGQSATEPTPSALHQVEVALNTKYRLAPSAAAFAMTTPAPPAANSFPAATPAEVRSAFGGLVFRGDGSGKIGPLTFHPDGSMTSTAVPEWVPVTTFNSGFTPGDFGFVPAYRVWPDGKVEWRGVVKGSMTATGQIITLPPVTVPAEAVNLTVSTNAGAGAYMMRVEFAAVGFPNGIAVYPGGVSRTWLSLDGAYYYLS